MAYKLSAFVEVLSKGNKSLVYHSISGQFLLLSGTVTIADLCRLTASGKKNESGLDRLIEALIDSGVVISAEENRRETERLAKMFVVMNPHVYLKRKSDKTVLLQPRPGSVKELELDTTLVSQWRAVKAKSKKGLTYSEFCKLYTDLAQLTRSHMGLVKLESTLQSTSSREFITLYMDAFNHKCQFGKTAVFKLTNACNLNCFMCGQAKAKRQGGAYSIAHINVDQMFSALDAENTEVNYINLWGGEPLMHPRFKEVVHRLGYRDRQYVSIATNGTLLAKYANILFETGIDEVAVSLDGPEQVHDDIRGRSGTFLDVINGIEAVKTARGEYDTPRIIVNCTVTDKNSTHLKEMIRICQEAGADQLVYQLPMYVTDDQGEGYSRQCHQLLDVEPHTWKTFLGSYKLDSAGLYEFYEYCRNEYVDFVQFYNDAFDSVEKLDLYLSDTRAYADQTGKNKTCIMKHAIVVDSDGSLVTCPDFPDIKYGHIEEPGLIRIEKKEKFFALMEDGNRYEICPSCCHYR